MGLVALLRYALAVSLAVLGLSYGYVRYLTIVYHTRDFHTVEDRQTVAQVLLEGFDMHSHYAKDIAQWAQDQYTAQVPPLKNKIIVVTGATRGLGKGIAGHLAAWGATLVLPCRRCNFDQLKQSVKGEAIAYAMKYGKLSKTEAESRIKVAEPYVFDVDLADLDQIDAFIAKYKEHQIPSADVLVNNAGLVSMYPARTKQGFETTFGVNFLAAAYLTEKMLESSLLKGKVVTVSSEEHRVGNPILDTVNESGVPFGGFFGAGLSDAMDRYGYTKLLETTYFLALARKRPSLKVLDLCPGPIASEIGMNAMWPINVIVTYLLDIIFPSVDKAALSVVRLVADKQYENLTGEHFHIYEKRPARGDARDEKIQDWLYDETQKLIRARRAPA